MLSLSPWSSLAAQAWYHHHYSSCPILISKRCFLLTKLESCNPEWWHVIGWCFIHGQLGQDLTTDWAKLEPMTWEKQMNKNKSQEHLRNSAFKVDLAFLFHKGWQMIQKSNLTKFLSNFSYPDSCHLKISIYFTRSK